MLGFLLLLLGAAGAAPLLGALQVEGLVSPLAIAVPFPRFSWRTGALQQSYRLRVFSASTALLLWDSGTVPSNASSQVAYAGAALPADADFSWALDVTLAGEGLLGAGDTFSTAPLGASLSGDWLGFADTLRASVRLSDAPITRARLHATAVGCYVLYVNGQRVSTELAPGFAHAPSARALYDTYNVAPLLHAGQENALGMRLGSCKWGAYGQYCTGTAAQCNAGWALLTVAQGGNVTTLASGPGGWSAANTSIVYENLWNGELLDARLEQEGWAAPGFANASAWPSASLAQGTEDRIGPLTPSRAPPVLRGQPLTPAFVTALSPTAHVFDLGPLSNMAGHCGLDLTPPPGEAPVPAGAAIQLLHGELLYANGNGSVWNPYLPPWGTGQGALNSPHMNYTYVTRGGGRELMHRGPHFAYFGFKFIELRGWPYAAPPTAAALTCYFLHSDLPRTSGLAFAGAPLLNALQAATLRTHLSNYVSLPTDCPQREKRGWTGDAQLTVHSGTMNFDTAAFYEGWWQSILDQQRIGCLPKGAAPGRVDGRAGAPIRPANWACDPPLKDLPNLTLPQYQFGPVSDVVPREQLGMGYFIGDPSWEVAAVAIPYELLTQLGDARAVGEGYDGPVAMLKWLNALGTTDPSSAGLITWSYLGDWCPIDAPNNKLVANVNYIMAALQLAEIAAALSKPQDSATYLALASRLSTAVTARFYNASAAHWDKGSQSAQVLPLAFGIGGPALAAPSAAALAAALAAAANHLTVGASGARYMLTVLHDALSPAAALALAMQDDYPSWGSFVTLGANATASPPGTHWEEWSEDSVKGGASLNHIFKAGGISTYLFESALGLTFALRPAGAMPAAAAAAAEACGCEGTLGLPWSPRARLGLSCAQVQVVCDVVAEAEAGAGAGAEGADAAAPPTHLDALSARVRAAWRAAGLQLDAPLQAAAAAAPLQPRVGLAVSSAAARMLGSAAGWRATPAGNVSLAWAWQGAGQGAAWSLRLEACVPAGVDALLELPLAACTGGRARLATGSMGAVEVDCVSWGVSSGSSRGGGGGGSVASARVSQCGAGAAAAHVEGGWPGPRGARQCEPVVTLQALPGCNAYELSSR